MDLLKATYLISNIDMSLAEIDIKKNILDIFCNVLNYERSVFWSVKENHSIGEPVFYQVESGTVYQYLDHFYQYDPLHPSNTNLEAPIQLMTQQNTFSTAKLLYYKNNFLEPNHCIDELGMYLTHNESLIGVIGLLKTKGQALFNKGDLLQLRYVKKLIENQLILHKFLQKTSRYQFTNREKDILEAVCQGKRIKEIALALFISENTVKKHLQNLYIKCEVDNKTALAMLYRNDMS